MLFDQFIQQLETSTHCPPNLSIPLQALWFDKKGDWAKAHALVQDESDRDSAWVHAYLHRVEGDLSNARYWYRRAGRPAATSELDREWRHIVTDLLSQEKM